MQNVHLTISSYWCFMPLSTKIQLYPGGQDILCLLRFLLHHPDCCRVMYCYSIITSPRLLSCDVLLFCVSFSLLLLFLLHHPNCCRVMYCYSTFLFHYYYYYSFTYFCPLDFSEMPWSNFMKPCRNIICHVKMCCEGLIFSSPDPKGHVSYCHHLASVVRL